MLLSSQDITYFKIHPIRNFGTGMRTPTTTSRRAIASLISDLFPISPIL